MSDRERCQIIEGDSRTALKAFPDAHFDSCVTDPPYALVSIVRRFANSPRSERTENTENPYGRTGRGFMGQKWDTGETAFDPVFWAEVMRVLKPGAHLLAFGGTRTFHRLVCAIEDAGFEVRDSCAWLYGSGFPKSLDVSKGIDKAAGASRKIIGKRYVTNAAQGKGFGHGEIVGGTVRAGLIDVTAPATEAARQWQGWGTALKPAMELICVARKPLSESTVAANVLAHGTGALNIDACRVVVADGDDSGSWGEGRSSGACWSPGRRNGASEPEGRRHQAGRWPANVCHDGSPEALAGFPKTQSGALLASTPRGKQENIYGARGHVLGERDIPANAGSAGRFFYTAKADANDRLGSKHPTVKPLALLRWLVRLVTPPRGLILDPFAGTGTTGMAALAEGMRAVLVEREATYAADCRTRIAHVSGRNTPLFEFAEATER